MAGLLGIGGGAVIVPVLALLFEHRGVDPDVIMHCAIGTSLATIAFTALASIRTHHAHGAVRWPAFRQLTPGIVAGGLLGAAIADALPGPTLKRMFAAFLLLIAVQMARGWATQAKRHLPGRAAMFAAGGVIGTLSSLFGVGGGSMSVPFLTWCGVPAREAVATAAAIGFPIALTGALGYIIAGWNADGLPPWSIGYVTLPAFAGIVIASMLSAPWGARLAHRLPEATLRRIFAVFLAAIGIYMLVR